MMQPVISCIASVLSLDQRSVSVLTTPSIGNVIPDVMLAEWQDGATCLRANVTHAEASILAALERYQTLSLSSLRKKVFLSDLSAERHLSRLERVGGIHRLKSGEISISEPVRSDRCEIIAIEVKMCRWREALEQAVGYQSFADQSYVALDASQVSLNESIFEAFEEANVGLLFQDGPKLSRLLRCRSKRCFSPGRTIAYQKLCRGLDLTTILPNTSSTFETLIARSFDDAHQCV
jgi:hypothetical protein